MKMFRSAALIIICGTLLAPARSQQGQEKQEQRPAFRVDVNLVTLDVVVTNKKGSYPTDLKAEDFEIYEDGVRQTIQDFQFLQPAAETRAGRSSSPPADPAAPEASRIRNSIAPEDRRLFILLFDNLNSRWQNFAQMEQAVEKFLEETLVEEDLVAILTANRSMRLLQNFTNHRPALLSAARSAMGRSVEGTITASENSAALAGADAAAAIAASIGSADAQDFADRAAREAAKLYALQNEFSARGTLITLRALCEALAELRGRKAVVLVSEGFGISSPIQSVITGTVGAANKANVAIYTINPRGLDHGDATQTTTLHQPARRRSFRTTGMVAAGNSDFDLIRLESSADRYDDGLSELSQSTGGLAIRNSNDFLAGLERIHRDSHSYYRMTYVPANLQLDGKFRKVEVRLVDKHRSLEVRSRRGYFATDAPGAFIGTLDDRMYQALYSPIQLKELDTNVAPSFFLDPKGDLLSHVRISLSSGGVGFSPVDQSYQARFRAVAAVFDESGRLAGETLREFPVTLTEEQMQQFSSQGASLRLSLDVPSGDYQLKTIVVDLKTGKMGTQRVDLSVPEYRPGEPYLSSIVLSRQVLPEDTSPGEGLSAEYNPFRYRDAVISPSASRSFSPEGLLTLLFHAYHVSSNGDEAERFPYAYQLILIKDGVEYNRTNTYALRSDHPHPLEGYVLAPQLPLADLPDGNYRVDLEIIAVGAGAIDRLRRGAAFEISRE